MSPALLFDSTGLSFFRFLLVLFPFTPSSLDFLSSPTLAVIVVTSLSVRSGPVWNPSVLSEEWVETFVLMAGVTGIDG